MHIRFKMNMYTKLLFTDFFFIHESSAQYTKLQQNYFQKKRWILKFKIKISSNSIALCIFFIIH